MNPGQPLWQQLCKKGRQLWGRLFPPAPCLFMTPQGVYLAFFQRGVPEVRFFPTIQAAARQIRQIGRPYYLYVDGFDQSLLLEPHPPLKGLEKLSYSRHRSGSLLEKAALVFTKYHPTVGVFLTENPSLPEFFKTAQPGIKGVRSLALEVSEAFKSPTLWRVTLPQGRERLLYGAGQLPYFTRTIGQGDEEEYAKSLRYMERQFHQNLSGVSTRAMAFEDLALFLLQAPRPLFQNLRKGIFARGHGPLVRPYLFRLALQSGVIFLGGSLLLQAIEVAQYWQNKEQLQSQLFQSTRTLQAFTSPPQGKGKGGHDLGKGLTKAHLHHFKTLKSKEAHPLADLQRLLPLNTPETFLKGLAWGVKNNRPSDPEIQMGVQVCGRHTTVGHLKSWISEALVTVTAPLPYTLTFHPAREQELTEEEDGGEKQEATEDKTKGKEPSGQDAVCVTLSLMKDLKK